MIKSVRVVSRGWVKKRKEQLTAKPDIAVISIVDPQDSLIWDVREVVQSGDWLRALKFSDIEPSPFLRHGWMLDSQDCFMDGMQAKIIVEFIHRLMCAPREVNLIIHCAAGICRSGAIGKFAQPFSVMRDAEFALVNPQIQPNMWVYNKLIEQWITSGLCKTMKPIQESEVEF